MSARSSENAPPAPYVEDCSDSQDEIPDIRPAPNSAKKVTRRDEASDSGYSSRTQATGSSSQSVKTPKQKPPKSSSSGGVLKTMAKKVSGNSRKPSKETAPAPPKPAKTEQRPSIVRRPGSPDLRRRSMSDKTIINESREEAARMNPNGQPTKAKTVTIQTAQLPSKASRPPQPAPLHIPPQPSQSITIPRVSARPPPYPTPQHRPRPHSYHPGVSSAPYYAIVPHPQQHVAPSHHPPPVIHNQPVYRAPQPPPFLSAPATAPASGPHHQSYILVGPGPSSPNRVIPSYGFEPTLPPRDLGFVQQPQSHARFPPQSHAYQGPQQRRNSMFSYPSVPQPSQPPTPHSIVTSGGMVYGEPLSRPPSHGQNIYSYSSMEASRAPEPSYSYDDDFYEEEMEMERAQLRLWEREREQEELKKSRARLMMPPPRPPMQRASTTSTAHVPRNPNRRSVEVSQPSSRKKSMDSGRPQLSSQSSGSGGHVREPVSPTTVRRRSHGPRPASFHDTSPHLERGEREAQIYQDNVAGASPHLAREDLENNLSRKVSKTKTHKSGPSETTSRASSKSDKKSKRNPSDKQRREDDGVTVRMKDMSLNIHGQGSINIKYNDKEKNATRASESKKSTKYLVSGSMDAETEIYRSRERSRSIAKVNDAVQRVKVDSKNNSRRSSASRPTTQIPLSYGPQDGIPF